MTKRFLAANWKMNGSLDLCRDYAKEFSKINEQVRDQIDILACPPSPYLGWLAIALADVPNVQISTGIQDITHIVEQGAHTGELHPKVLKDIGSSHAIIGHSERRSGMDESNQLIGQKMNNCFANGIVPVLCVGESAEQRQNGESETVIAKQLTEAFAECSRPDQSAWPELLIAYEPFWAIGSGQAATPEIIVEIHAFIRRHCNEQIGLNNADFRILYGGSVNRKNIDEIAAIDEVDGGLIGGASLDAAHFAELALAFAR